MSSLVVTDAFLNRLSTCSGHGLTLYRFSYYAEHTYLYILARCSTTQACKVKTKALTDSACLFRTSTLLYFIMSGNIPFAGPPPPLSYIRVHGETDREQCPRDKSSIPDIKEHGSMAFYVPKENFAGLGDAALMNGCRQAAVIAKVPAEPLLLPRRAGQPRSKGALS